jgi:hypothetical protein
LQTSGNLVAGEIRIGGSEGGLAISKEGVDVGDDLGLVVGAGCRCGSRRQDRGSPDGTHSSS